MTLDEKLEEVERMALHAMWVNRKRAIAALLDALRTCREQRNDWIERDGGLSPVDVDLRITKLDAELRRILEGE